MCVCANAFFFFFCVTATVFHAASGGVPVREDNRFRNGFRLERASHILDDSEQSEKRYAIFTVGVR